MTTDSSTLFWVTSRAAGTTAMVLSSAAVGMGLTMGGKLIRRWGPERRTLHEILSLATMVALVVHGLSLLGDSWLHPSVLDVSVPFFASYDKLYTSIGIVAGWGMIVLGLSYYARKRIGNARWKLIHRFTALAWLLGLLHAFTEGTDAGQLWFVALVGLTAAPAVVLLIVRHTRPRAPVSRPGPASARVPHREIHTRQPPAGTPVTASSTAAPR